tara:strand:+ start:158 stop:475 length:318 start_codon:yes stop_codon:yes gene_type:complete
MKVLRSVDEAVEEFSKLKIQPPNKLTSTNYPDGLVFECGCESGGHRVNDPTNTVIGIQFPVYFVMRCVNDYLTFFRVKGIFTQKAYTIWTCDKKTGQEALKKIGI